jgi:hypothetical protein
VRYAPKLDYREFFTNMTAVFPTTCGVGFHTETVSGSAELSLDPSREPNRAKWQDRHIIPD